MALKNYVDCALSIKSIKVMFIGYWWFNIPVSLVIKTWFSVLRVRTLHSVIVIEITSELEVFVQISKTDVRFRNITKYYKIKKKMVL